MKIFKYELKVEDSCNISMPNGATILSLQVIDEKPYIYACVDESSKTIERTFLTFGTGHTLPFDNMIYSGMEYLGTYQLQGGALVFHVFEEL